MELPKRKTIRLKEYDYNLPGAYFITICVKNKKPILSDVFVGASIARPKEIRLSKYGKIVDKTIKNIPFYYPAISIDNYVIMPNHIHLLIQIRSDNIGRPMVAPTIERVIQQMKGIITKQIGFSIWQKSFNDHIIRGNFDYKEIWEYIENNALKWREDKYYIKEE